jgi:hypothetical protein
MKNKMKSSKMLKKANALKGFLGSMSKKKGEMGMGTGATPITQKTNYKQSSSLGVPMGTKYTTTVEKPKVRQTLGEYNTPPRSQAEASRYQQLKSSSIKTSKPSMKKGGSFPDLNKDGQITKADILMGRGVIDKPKGQKGMNVMKEAKKNATRTITDGYKGTGAPNPLAAIVKNTAKKSKMGKKPKMQMGGNTRKMPRYDVTERYSADMINRMPSKNTPTDSATLNKSLNILNSLTDSIGKKETIKKGKMKPKMAMGGAFFPQNPLTMSKYQDDNLNNQYYKKGGMVKKKKK